MIERRRCGQRRTYDAGCRCFACRLANAQYQQRYRQLLREGKVPPGRLTDAAPTWRLVMKLTREGFSRAALAGRLGLRAPQLQWDHQRVTGRTAGRLARFYARVMAE